MTDEIKKAIYEDYQNNWEGNLTDGMEALGLTVVKDLSHIPHKPFEPFFEKLLLQAYGEDKND